MTSNVDDVARKIVIRLCRIWLQHYKIRFYIFKGYKLSEIAWNIHSYIIKGLSHLNRWILSLIGISTEARKLASFDIPTWGNIHRYQCNNLIVLVKVHVHVLNIVIDIMTTLGNCWWRFRYPQVLKSSALPLLHKQRDFICFFANTFDLLYCTYFKNDSSCLHKRVFKDNC